MVLVVFEIEYDVETEEEARACAERDAGQLLAQDDVRAIAAGLQHEYAAHALPITERYLEDDGPPDKPEPIN